MMNNRMPRIILMRIIGNTIKAAREERGILQKELADAIGVSDAEISRWESGIRLPTTEHIRSLCQHLSIDANIILGLL